MKQRDSLLPEIKARYKVNKLSEDEKCLRIECNHGDASNIGQFALRSFEGVYTYFACHIFRKAHLAIYFN